MSSVSCHDCTITPSVVDVIDNIWFVMILFMFFIYHYHTICGQYFVRKFSSITIFDESPLNLFCLCFHQSTIDVVTKNAMYSIPILMTLYLHRTHRVQENSETKSVIFYVKHHPFSYCTVFVHMIVDHFLKRIISFGKLDKYKYFDHSHMRNNYFIIWF